MRGIRKFTAPAHVQQVGTSRTEHTLNVGGRDYLSATKPRQSRGPQRRSPDNSPLAIVTLSKL